MRRTGRTHRRSAEARRSFVPRTSLAVSILLAAAVSSADTTSVVIDVADTTTACADTTSVAIDVADSTAVSVDTTAAPESVVVYYFHRTARCDNCLKFEAYTDEAINSGFETELAGGSLVWQTVNLDEAENEHYVYNFDVSRSSVVLVRYGNNEPTKWAHLDEIWTHVDDRPVFIAYIQSEVGRWLGDLEAGGPEKNEEAPPDSTGG